MGVKYVAAAGLVVMAGCDQLQQLPFWPSKKPQSTTNSSTGGAPAAQLGDPGVLALVNGSPITSDEFRRRVEVLPEDDPRGYMTEVGSARAIYRKPRTKEERHILLEELIKEELLVQEAKALRLEREPDVARQMEETQRQILVLALTRRDVEGATVSEEEVEEYYKRFQEGYKEPEKIKVRQIVTATLSEAEAIRATAVQGIDFGQLARERSIGEGKDRGGEVGWYVRAADKELAAFVEGRTLEEKTFFEQLEPVAFALEIGQVSSPVKGPGGYYLVRVEERQATKPRLLNEVWDQIHGALLFQKRQRRFQEHIQRLWKNATIEQNEQRLEQLG